jgi:FMN phosphatase YigB (HAD superfamily)
VQSRKIDGLGIPSWFASIVISEAAGVRKPDPQIPPLLHAVPHT